MRRSWRLYFLNVGDGDCIYMENDIQSFTMLIDGGRWGATIVGFLQEKGVDHLDLLISTHCHQDHAGGIAAVLDLVPVEKFWCPYPQEDRLFKTEVIPGTEWSRQEKMGIRALAAYHQLLAQVVCKKIPFESVVGGSVYRYDELVIAVAYPSSGEIDSFCHDARAVSRNPDAAGYGRLMGKMNATSLFITLNLNNTLIHLPSDPPVNKVVLSNLKRCQLLKLSHHGCIDGVNSMLFAYTKPQKVVISAARDSGEFPSSQTVELLKKAQQQDGLDFNVHYTDTSEELPYLLFEISPEGKISKKQNQF